MKVLKKKSELFNWKKTINKKTIGFVPTMGALHLGHLSLIQEAKNECDLVVVSIFVNKLQFGPKEDFKQYPRTLEQDIKLLKQGRVDVLFLPDHDEIYPCNLSLQINELNISTKLEGASRPGFFSGVLMIVLKLFNLVKPNFVYFGEKDIQQLYIIKKMIEDLDFQITIRPCPTIRESSGLAISSRNQYLSEHEKKDASILYKTLKKGEELIKKNKKIDYIKQQMKELVTNKNVVIDYLSIASLENFEEAENSTVRPVVISGAIYYKDVRLIDNLIVKK